MCAEYSASIHADVSILVLSFPPFSNLTPPIYQTSPTWWYEMSSKEKEKKNTKKWSSEDVVQAVVIADSFNFCFLPITAEKPRALLPLVNRPLIDYTVEFLAVSGVKEIYVYCCAHVDQLRAHLDKSRWTQKSSSVKLSIITSKDFPSVGDALRDIDAQGLIRSDFVLVSGDLVSNMDLREVIAKHKQLREKDKMTVMTNVYKRAHPGHRTRSMEDDILLATNSTTDRVLFCEKPDGKKKIKIPVAMFKENDKVEINYDVLDCHISVCSPSVPQLFSDNFDYQTRYHFIRGIINDEVLGNTIYADFICDQYAARVSNLQTYEAISKDVIHRWVFPLVPDNCALEEAYSYGRRNIYLSINVALAFDCILEEDVVLGSESSVGPQTHITHSSIGRNCKIGKGVKIEGCYIWNDVTIGDHCILQKSIIASNVVIKPNVTVEDGCIISFNVVIGEGFTVQAGSRLTTSQQAALTSSDGWEDDNESSVNDKPFEECVVEDVGEGGKGFKWDYPIPDSDDESDNFIKEKWHTTVNTQDEEEDEESISEESTPSATPELVQLLSVDKDSETVMFYHEILDSIRSSLTDSVPNDNTILMINASKHAYNVPINEVPLHVVKAILEGPPSSSSKAEMMEYIIKAFRYFQSLLVHYMKEKEVQKAVIVSMSEYATKDKSFASLFAKYVLELYNLDVVEESSILEWYAQFSLQTDNILEYSEVLRHIQPVIEWLETAEEESEEESD